MVQHRRVIVVGAGFCGIGIAIRLLQEGRGDFVVLERAAAVGGVWRDNTYPGCACDVESHAYCFSFAPNPGWSRTYSPQGEILSYLEGLAERCGVTPHLRLNTPVESARWDRSARLWRVSTPSGEWTCDVLITANGGLSEPAIPPIPGLDGLEIPCFHTARWRSDVDLTGDVAVVGTGASAIQLVPHLARAARRLYVFQRTPPWVLPHTNPDIPAWRQGLYGAAPWLMRLTRAKIFAQREVLWLGFHSQWVTHATQWLARRYLKSVVKDQALRARLTPRYAMGCKRILLSDTYLQALQRPNVELVTEPITTLRGRSVVTGDGAERALDAVVLATGFHVADHPMAARVQGRGGRSLAEHWRGSPVAHLGTTVDTFPNLFMLSGPNTGLGHSSVLAMFEAQFELILRLLAALDARRARTVEPTPEAVASWRDEIDRGMAGSAWTAGGCASWYLDQTGRNSTLWPGPIATFVRRLGSAPLSDYVFDVD